MTMKKITALLLCLAMLFSLAACSAGEKAPVASETPEVSEAPAATETPAQSEPEQSASGLTLTDMTGRTIEMDKPAEKIVALLASDVEILYALGAGDKIVGVGEYCNYPAEALEKQVVASGADTNIEEIIALDPDAVVIGTMAQSQEQISQLENAGIKVIVTDSDTIDDVYVNLELLGKLTGLETEAQQITEQMKDGFAALTSDPGDGEPKTVYIEVSPLEYGLWTTGTDTFLQEILDMLGVKNIFDDVSGWAEISEEQVLQRNPDYIVTLTMYFGEGPTPEEEILGRANWQDVNAVKNGKVLCADSDMLTRPGPRLVEGAKELRDFIFAE
jgi:iron complex transport system substrate-binding protein